MPSMIDGRERLRQNSRLLSFIPKWRTEIFWEWLVFRFNFTRVRIPQHPPCIQLLLMKFHRSLPRNLPCLLLSDFIFLVIFLFSEREFRCTEHCKRWRLLLHLSLYNVDNVSSKSATKYAKCIEAREKSRQISLFCVKREKSLRSENCGHELFLLSRSSQSIKKRICDQRTFSMTNCVLEWETWVRHEKNRFWRPLFTDCLCRYSVANRDRMTASK